MTTKKDKKKEVEEQKESETPTVITNKAEFRSFVSIVRNKLLNGEAPPIHSMAALNHTLSTEGVCELIDLQSRELLQEIYVHLSQQNSLHINRPPALFGDIDGSPK